MKRVLLLLAVCLLPVTAAMADEPVKLNGNPAELSIFQISPKTIRLALSPLSAQGNPAGVPTSSAFAPYPSVEKLRVRALAAETRVDLGTLSATIKSQPFTVTLQRSDGKPIQELSIDPADGSLTFNTNAPVYGLGEGQHQFDRRGARYTMVNGQTAPFLATHGATIPVPFLIGADGWAMFVSNPWGQFDLQGTRGRFIPRQSQNRQPLEVFLIAIDEPADAMAEYVRLFGNPAMPPKWALGYMQSHRTLAGPQEPLEITHTFRQKQLPCDALIYLGTGYCPAGWNTGHGSLEFNPKTFDRPKETIDALHADGFKIILHINHAPRDLFGTSVNEKSDSPLHISNYWARHLVDFSLGVDAWWPDDGDELPIESRLARIRCYYEGPLAARPNERPWSLDRNGYAGVARLGGWIWSGDVQSRWATLAAHVPVGLNFSMSVSPFWGTDIGGFVPTRELTGELYARWLQFATFNPLFRSHGRTWHLRLPWGWNTGDAGPVETNLAPDPAELHNPQIEPICKTYLELRYKLLPYNYSIVKEACDSGLPMMRALWLHYPHDAQAAQLGDEYLWGRDLLIAPVVEKGAASRHLYLPAGDWYDWWTGQKTAGGKWIDRPVDLATLPIFVKSGAIIPLDPIRQYTSQPITQPTTLQIYPGADGAFTLYDDDGHTLGYQQGGDNSTIWLDLKWNDGGRVLTIAPDSRMKKWIGGVKEFDVRLMGERSQPARVRFSGEKTEVGI